MLVTLHIIFPLFVFCWVCAHLVSHTWGESEAFHTGTDGLGWIGGRSMGQEHDMSV